MEKLLDYALYNTCFSSRKTTSDIYPKCLLEKDLARMRRKWKFCNRLLSCVFRNNNFMTRHWWWRVWQHGYCRHRRTEEGLLEVVPVDDSNENDDDEGEIHQLTSSLIREGFLKLWNTFSILLCSMPFYTRFILHGFLWNVSTVYKKSWVYYYRMVLYRQIKILVHQCTLVVIVYVGCSKKW